LIYEVGILISTSFLDFFGKDFTPETGSFQDLDLGRFFLVCNMHDAIYAPGRLTWNLRIHPWKRKIISQFTIFRFFVDLLGCKICCNRIADIFFTKKNCGHGGDCSSQFWFTGGYFWVDIGTSKGYPYAPCMEYCPAFRINVCHSWISKYEKSSHGILWELYQLLYIHHSREFLKLNPGSQPPFLKWWFLLEDDKPLQK